MLKRKWIIGTVIIIIIGVVLFMVFANNKKAAAAAVVEEKTYTLALQTLTKNLYTDGVVQVDREQQVFSEVSGTVESIVVEVGDVVADGDLLMILDTSRLKESLEQAKYQLIVDQDALRDLKATGNSVLDAAYERSLASYNRAKQTYENNKVLLSQGAISQTELDQSSAAVDSAYSEYLSAKDRRDNTNLKNEIEKLATKVKIDQIAVDDLADQMGAVQITAPLSGTVTAIATDVGMTTSAGQSIITISDLSQLSVSAMVSEYDIPQVKIGQAVEITTLGDADKTYNGKVTDVAPIGTVSGSEVLVEVTVQILDPDQMLKPNFTANLNILIDQKENALAVPFDALIETPNGKSVVLKKMNGQQERIPVKKGIETDLYVEVISDQLAEGDILVLPNTSTSGNNAFGKFPFGGAGGKSPDGGQIKGN